jgi:hypothetical protein
MQYNDCLALFERCMEDVDHAPLEHRHTLLEIAASLLRLAGECTSSGTPQQNAPTTNRLQ